MNLTEEDFNDIEIAASKAMREWERGYVCQDINIRHHISWWIALETNRRANEWRRIETAPRDGTKVLLCLTGYQPVVGYFDGDSERWEYQDSGDFVEEDHWFAWQEQTGDWLPDHWMPLPEPPK